MTTASVRSDALDAKLVDVALGGQRNHRTVRWLTGVVVADVLLTLGLGAVAVGLAREDQRAANVAIAARVACESTNQFRTRAIALWAFVLSRADLANERTVILPYVRRLYAPHVCPHV